eukprot:350699-Chlamydomonas_euryale.AAC.19
MATGGQTGSSATCPSGPRQQQNSPARQHARPVPDNNRTAQLGNMFVRSQPTTEQPNSGSRSEHKYMVTRDQH